MRFIAVSVASIAAVAVAGVLTLGAAHAVPKVGEPGIGATVELVKYKKKHHRWHHCGTYKYHKRGKCHDARNKK